MIWMYDHELVEIRILRTGMRMKSKLTALERRLGLFKEIKIGRYPWDKSLEGRGAWLMFKYHLLQAQESSIPKNMMSVKNARKPAQMKKELPRQTQTQKESLLVMETRTGKLGRIQKQPVMKL